MPLHVLADLHGRGGHGGQYCPVGQRRTAAILTKVHVPLNMTIFSSMTSPTVPLELELILVTAGDRTLRRVFPTHLAAFTPPKRVRHVVPTAPSFLSLPVADDDDRYARRAVARLPTQSKPAVVSFSPLSVQRTPVGLYQSAPTLGLPSVAERLVYAPFHGLSSTRRGRGLSQPLQGFRC